MKKLISILLVAMLIIGMFPATALTAFAEDTVVATFEFGADGSASHSDTSSAKTSYTENDGDYTLTLTGANMYPGSRDAKGNGCIKLGASSKAGSFSFTAPDNVTSVVIYVAKYKANTTKVTVNGTAYTLTNASNNGAYDAITVDTTTTKTVSLTTVSGGYRAMLNTIEFVAAGGSTEPDCEHTNWELQDDVKETCTTDGYTGDKFCLDCETVFAKGETIGKTNHANKVSNNDAIEADCETEGFTDSYYCPDCKTTIPAVSTGYGDHSYVDGACEVCGEAEPAVKEGTISFASDAQRVSQDSSKQVWANEGITFTNNKAASTNAVVGNVGPVRLYANSELVFEAPSAIIEIYVDCNSASYATALKNSITDATVVVASDKVTITPNGSSNTFTVAKLSAQTRFDSLTITYEGASASDCEHTNKTEQNDGYAATCTEEGKTNSWVCDDCGEIAVPQETIDPINHANKISNDDAIEKDCETEGFTDSYFCPDCEITIPAVSTGFGNHIYVDGACSVCGEEQPDEVTLSLANGTNRTSYSTTQQVYAGNGITLTNDKAGASTDVYNAFEQDHARFYKGSTVTIACAGMTKIVLQCDGAEYLFNLAESEDYTVTVDGTTVTVEFTAAVDTYTFTMSQNQARVNSLTVSCAAGAEPECTHENKVSNEDAQAPTCVNPGQTDSYTCPDCGETIDAEPIPATGEHNYVDGACTMCGAGEPERYYIAAYRDSEKAHYYMTSDLGDKSTKRYQAAAVAGNALPTKIEAAAGYVFILTDNGDGTCYLQAEGIEGNNYLGWTSGNSGALVAEANALKLTMVITENGYYNFSFQPEGAEKARYLSLNGTKDNNYFAWYEGTQKQDLVLIPVEEIADDEVITMSLHGDAENVAVGANQILDLNGHAATNVTGTNISVYDSTATLVRNEDKSATITAGTGKLTLADGASVIIDNTVDGLRYIALENEGTYTFHILELKLSAVSLRTSAAGIYYKAVLYCDATLKNAVDYHGMIVSVNDMPGADFLSLGEEGKNSYTQIAGAPEEGKFTSCSVFGIFKPGRTDNTDRGEMKIYANAYIQLKESGEILVADTTNGDEALNEDGTKNEDFDGIAWSLCDVMKALDATFVSLDETKQTNIVKFYKNWASAMSGWNLQNIAAAATSAA